MEDDLYVLIDRAIESMRPEDGEIVADYLEDRSDQRHVAVRKRCKLYRNQLKRLAAKNDNMALWRSTHRFQACLSGLFDEQAWQKRLREVVNKFSRPFTNG